MLCLSKKRKCSECGLLFCWGKIVSRAEKHIQGFSFTRILPILVLAGGLGAFFILGGAEYLAFETFRDNREFLLDFVERNGVAAVLAYMAVYAAAMWMRFGSASNPRASTSLETPFNFFWRFLRSCRDTDTPHT
jgi:hypothetical protein